MDNLVLTLSYCLHYFTKYHEEELDHRGVVGRDPTLTDQVTCPL